MSTDWNLVRRLMNVTLDACEVIEKLQLDDAEKMVKLIGNRGHVFELLTAAWTAPETTRYNVIRARHDLKNDKPFQPEIARILAAASAVAVELLGADNISERVAAVNSATPGNSVSILEMINALLSLYEDKLIPLLTSSIEEERRKSMN